MSDARWEADPGGLPVWVVVNEDGALQLDMIGRSEQEVRTSWTPYLEQGPEAWGYTVRSGRLTLDPMDAPATIASVQETADEIIITLAPRKEDGYPCPNTGDGA